MGFAYAVPFIGSMQQKTSSAPLHSPANDFGLGEIQKFHGIFELAFKLENANRNNINIKPSVNLIFFIFLSFIIYFGSSLINTICALYVQ